MTLYLLGVALLLCAFSAAALPADKYALNSKLSAGNWAKIKVDREGMQLISIAQLRQLGFNDPAKVHVYGVGGRELPLGLTSVMTDDLPLVPSVVTPKGLVFFATDHFSWQLETSVKAISPYKHSIHKYSDDTYYFISDIAIDAELTEMSTAAASPASASDARNSFAARIVHEKDLIHIGESGANWIGEDFRSKKLQTFKFDLPDRADNSTIARIKFGAKTTGGSGSSIIVSANGNKLPATTQDKVGNSEAAYYCRYTSSEKEFSFAGESLEIGIDYSYTGTLFTAGLDYIEVFYNRLMRLRNDELYFYDLYEAGEKVAVEGCSESTQIWDVTDPANIAKVKFTLANGVASFAVANAGYREFVAFNPEKISRTVTPAGVVSNQDIHGLETPDMVIVTLPIYLEGAKRIAKLHEDVDGFRVHVICVDEIYNEFSGGKPDISAVRRMLKMWYDRGEDSEGHKLQHCLMYGKPSYDNKLVTSAVKNAYQPLIIWQSEEGYTETSSYSTDDLLSMLEDVENEQFRIESSKMCIGIGRIPVASTKDALNMAAKIERYVKTPTYGPWRNKVMIIADDDDHAEHFDQAEKVYEAMRSAGNGASYVYDKLYLDSYKRVLTSRGPTYPQATQRMLRNYNDGVMLTNYIGHASPTGWGHEHLFEWPDITSMTNRNLTFIYAATCGFAYFDNVTLSGAEEMLLNPEAGAIGFMAAIRTVYISSNGVLNKFTSSHMFERGEDGRPLTFGEVFIKGKNDYRGDTNKLRYALLGDPAIRVPAPEYTVKFNSIAGVDLADSNAEMPELAAMSSADVEGEIVDINGNTVSDFSGVVNVQLYDAEKVITTYGQGTHGKEVTYNDRTTRLSAANAEVENGKWKINMRVPPEIAGNYSPALLAGYAHDEKGNEANGVCDSFYVFGYADNVADNQGPAIEKLYVNNESFTNGQVVSPNSILFATLRDESGINISDGGIGHSMTLSLDNGELFSDLASYYEQDAYDPDCGVLRYPLSGITPGKHTLTLTAWDNANNMSKSQITINVGAAVEPEILELSTNVSPARESVVFRITVDAPNTRMNCTLGVYDLNGRRLWSEDVQTGSNIDGRIMVHWDLKDNAGNRVPRGIYIYRATVETPEGTTASKSKKLPVAAQ